MKIIYLVIWAMLVFPSVAWANVVWPAMILQFRLLAWWIILAGLIIEYFFIRKLFHLDSKRAVIAVFQANVFSALAGLILVPVGGLIWELTLSPLLYSLLKWETFNPVSWIAALMMASIVNALLEGYVFKKHLKLDFRFKSNKFWWLVLANVLTVGIAMTSILMEPPERTIGVRGELRAIDAQ